jgi:FtsP/CotA-like multicopper oxidase with cupredoxin domain
MKLLLSCGIGLALIGCGLNVSDKPTQVIVSSKPAVVETMGDFPCHQMGGQWMGKCKFDADGNPLLETPKEATISAGREYDTSTVNLPTAKKAEVVMLEDGQNYEMEAGFVKQEIAGKTLRRLAYNGMIPGPIFKVKKGTSVSVNFTNNLDEPTMVHSHGLRGDYKMDGMPNKPHPPLQPGESFNYKWEFPDEGIFWYHPHIREDRQQDGGLYGNYWVEPDTPDYWAKVSKEATWILDDFDLEGYDSQEVNHTLMGRYGSIMLLNNEENYQTTAKAGETVRYFITNTANVRPFNLKIKGAQMKLVGGDLGRIEQETFRDSLVIAPAERWIVEVYFPEAGRYEIENVTPKKTYSIGGIVVAGAATTDQALNFETLRDNREDYRDIRSFIESDAQTAPDKKLRLDVNMPGMKTDNMGHGGHNAPPIEWEDGMAAMNAMSTDKSVEWKLVDDATGKANLDINWEFEQGDLVKIEIYNDPDSMHPMQHPIHFHGQRFLVTSRDGVANQNLQWKDTALIKTGEKVEILVDMSNPGQWMAHCHIAEHLHAGMTLNFTVKPKN